MDTTHAELIEDLVDDAVDRASLAWHRRFARMEMRPRIEAHRFYMRVLFAARAIGNHRLAQAEDSADATRECAEAARLAFAVSASIAEARARRAQLTAAVSG